MPGPDEKSFAIPRLMVWEAWRQVKANKGAPGVDGQDLEEFEADLRDNLYKIWNRMSSGSYFPPPVRAVEIPKPHGDGVRMLGVPTIADRVAQTVVAMHLEQRADHRFHPDSYGYRPGKLMRAHGGFEHNAQSLRIVEVIEQKYPRFPGLNLSWEVREGLQKHARFYDPPPAKPRRKVHQPLARSPDRESRRRDHLLQPRSRRRPRLPSHHARATRRAGGLAAELRGSARAFSQARGQGTAQLRHPLHHRSPGAGRDRDERRVHRRRGCKAPTTCAGRRSRSSATATRCSTRTARCANFSTRISTTIRASPGRTSAPAALLHDVFEAYLEKPSLLGEPRRSASRTTACTARSAIISPA